jgi:uncharacterized protein (UPF0335 family)
MNDVETTSIHSDYHPASPAIGDNSSKFAQPIASGSPQQANEQLRSFVGRIERLEEEKKTIGHDIRDVYIEAKSDGYDLKALRSIIRLRKMNPNDRAKQETILDTYMRAMGML